MFIGWLTCIPAVLLPHSLCRLGDSEAPANRQMPIASVVSRQCKKPTRKWHIWFLPTHEPMLKKPKEPFFANARTDEQTEKSNLDD